MDAPPGSADGRRVVGSLAPHSGLSPALPHPYDPQMPLSAFSSPTLHPMYHPHAAHTPYIPMNWHVSMVQPNSQTTRPSRTRRSPPDSDDGDSRTESGSSHRSGSFATAAQRTLFIAGFPADVKEREIYNLLRFQPGFVDCSLTPGLNGKQSVAFASWQDHDAATRCRDSLQGLRFDPYGPVSFLRVQFARSESKSRRSMLEHASMMVVQSSSSSNDATSSSSSPSHSSPPSGTAGSGSSPTYGNGALDSRASRETSPSSGAAGSESTDGSPDVSEGSLMIKNSDSLTRTSRPRQRDNRTSRRNQISPVESQSRRNALESAVGVSGLLNGALSPDMSSSGTMSTTSPSGSGSSPEGSRSADGSLLIQSSSSGSPSPSDRARPCSTLFLTNLNLLVTETDLVNLFERREGFRRLRFQLNSEGVPISFVDFDNEVNSTIAREKLQGYLLHRTPLRIEYARQKMKRPRKRSR